MKNKKFLVLGLSALALTASVSLAACSGGGEGGAGGGRTTYTMEAEYVDIVDVIGSGLSSDQSGYNLIYGDGTQAQKDLGWSSGYYVGYTYTTEFKLDFVFEADKATTATIIIRLGSELGNIMLTPDNFEVSLNDTPINYAAMTIDNSESMASMKFSDKTLTNNASLVQGENTISIKILENDLRGSTTGGPTIDCIKVQTDAKLTYMENTDNPAKRGSI